MFELETKNDIAITKRKNKNQQQQEQQQQQQHKQKGQQNKTSTTIKTTRPLKKKFNTFNADFHVFFNVPTKPFRQIFFQRFSW